MLVPKGESYYYWTLGFRGRKRISRTYPNRRQLTQSEHLHRIYDLEDAQCALSQIDDVETLKSEMESFIADVQEYADELQDRLSSMPDQLQDSSVLNERIEALEYAVNELESIDLDYEADEDANEVLQAEHLASWLSDRNDEIQAVSFN